MSGWNASKVEVFKAEYYAFLSHLRINSKDKGNIILGANLYRAQHRFFDAVFSGLAQDKHDVKHLKSRQLGISTGSRALTLFWAGIHPGLKGYMIFDTDAHKEEARLELIGMIAGLPPSLRFPRIKRQNRIMLELENGTYINFAAGGVGQRKGSGALGRSSGVNFCHVSELCSIDNPDGLEAFMNALSEEFPDRLYIWESTARGFNQWHEMWTEAKADPVHQVTVFSGWWSKDNQIIPRNHPDYERYGLQPPTERELKKIREVKDLYDWSITPEQLAWVRRKMDPTAKPDGDAPAEFVGTTLRLAEQPWTEEDAFQQTGSIFFDPEQLTHIANKHTSRVYKTYSYSTGMEFVDCRIFKATNSRSVELKVWEEPVDEAVYVIAVDVAFGANEKNDRSAIQVMRCYADGIDQVAEYAWPLINSRQFAWVIASLLGWYAGDKSDVYLILELNGPGEATWNELQSLKRQIAQSYTPKEIEERGLRNIFQNVRNYLYSRSDSMSPGRNYHWRTTPRLKVTIMERLRDFVSNGMLTIRSMDTVEEMKSITRSGEDGDEIRAQGAKKDDRVISLALGVRCWEERPRRMLIAQKRTRANEELRRRLTIRDQVEMFNQAHFEQFFAIKSRLRSHAAAVARRDQWRNRPAVQRRGGR